MSTFSERLKQLRIENGENQSDVAGFLGVSVQSYSAYEGSREPKYELLVKLAKYFKVSTDYLLGASDTKKPENGDVSKRLGLSEKAIDILENKYRIDNRNPFTLTVNTLIEWPALLQLISQYLYCEVDKDAGLPIPAFATKYKYSNGGMHYMDSVKDFDYMEATETLDVLDTEKYKKLVVLEIQEALAHLLEKENSAEHF